MRPTKFLTQKTIGLALSGGGMRAAAFHAGVLKYLAEQNLLEKIAHISSVSGGSLFAGLVFRLANYKWPSSTEYLNDVLPSLRQTITTRCLHCKTLRRWIAINCIPLLINPFSWLFALYCWQGIGGLCFKTLLLFVIWATTCWISRVNVLAYTMKRLWGISSLLSALPNFPVWSINATSSETGRRFRFKGMTMGDYEIAYADASSFSLAKAMAISSAFPGLVGPMKMNANKWIWKRPEKTDDKRSASAPYSFSLLYLYDGGVYDNLGIEPMFDASNQILKKDETLTRPINYLISSDGGAKLPRKLTFSNLDPKHFIRIVEIILDQVHALRVRAFVNFLKNNRNSGAYVGIGACAKSTIQKYSKGRETIAARLLNENWLSDEAVDIAKDYDTNLKKMSAEHFDRLVQHGYETAKWNMELFTQP